MSKRDKNVDVDQQKPEAIGEVNALRAVAQPKVQARAWATVNKLPGAGKKFDARRKVPSGPLGGSGRKTNVSRSS